MRPFHHARASAKRTGRHWREDLEIHEFLDSSKVAYPDLRHRMLLHSTDLGGELAVRAFPSRADIREVVSRHIQEDLGELRTLRDWLGLCNCARLPRPHPRALPIDEAELLAAEQQRQGLADAEGPRAVLEILRLPTILAPEFEEAAWCILGNAFGPGLVRRVLGPPVEVVGRNGTPTIFDPAWCAEAIIHFLFRAIPEVRSVVTALRS
jgi:Domain of unknown function (DUF6915)